MESEKIETIKKNKLEKELDKKKKKENSKRSNT